MTGPTDPRPGQPPPPPGPWPYPVALLSPAEQRQWAMLAHLSVFVLAIAGPAIIWAMYKERGPFARRHAAEALNFHVFFLVVWLVSVLVAVVVGFATLGVGLFVVIPLLIAEWVLVLVFTTQAAVAANRGAEYRYPISVRFFS